MGFLLILVVCFAVLKGCHASAIPKASDRPHCLSTKMDFEGILVTCRIPRSRSKPHCEICVLFNDISTNEALDTPSYNVTKQDGYTSGECSLTYYPRAAGYYSFIIEIFPFGGKLHTNKVSVVSFPTMTLERLAPPALHCGDSDVTLNCTWAWLWKPDQINVTMETDRDVYMSKLTRVYSQGAYFIYEIISKLDFGCESRNAVIECKAHYHITGYGQRARRMATEIIAQSPGLGVVFKSDQGEVIVREHTLPIGGHSSITCSQTGGVEGRAVKLNVTCVGWNLNIVFHGISTSRVSFTVYGNQSYHGVNCECTGHLDRAHCITKRMTVRVVTEAYPVVSESQRRMIELNPVFQHVNGSKVPEVYSVSGETNSSVQCNVNASHPIKLQINVTCWDIYGKINLKLIRSEAPVPFNMHGDSTSYRTVCLCTASATALSATTSVQSNTAFLIHQVNMITSNDVSDTANTVVRMGRTKISIVSAYYLLAGVIAIVLLPLIIASIVYLCLSCKEANILYSPPNSGSNSGQTRSNSYYDSIRDTTKSSAESSPLPPQGSEPLLDSTSNYDSHDASDSGSSVQEHRYDNATSDEQDTGYAPTANPPPTP